MIKIVIFIFGAKIVTIMSFCKFQFVARKLLSFFTKDPVGKGPLKKAGARALACIAGGNARRRWRSSSSGLIGIKTSATSASLAAVAAVVCSAKGESMSSLAKRIERIKLFYSSPPSSDDKILSRSTKRDKQRRQFRKWITKIGKKTPLKLPIFCRQILCSIFVTEIQII